MIARALVVWLLLCAVAIANGTFRQCVLVPNFGAGAGYFLSSVSLSVLILVVAWCSIRWIGPSTDGQAWTVGILWLLATVAFEFGAGHYLFRSSWSKLLADYDVRQGRIWVLVLLATALAPRWAAAARGLLGGRG